MIYIIPFPLIDKEEINVKEKTRGFKFISAPSFWYLHGVLESKFKFDGAYMFVNYRTSKTEMVETFDNMLYLKPGIYNDVVVEGYDKPCRAYMWQREITDKAGKIKDLRGVVIDPTDEDDVKYAEMLYDKKPFAY